VRFFFKNTALSLICFFIIGIIAGDIIFINDKLYWSLFVLLGIVFFFSFFKSQSKMVYFFGLILCFLIGFKNQNDTKENFFKAKSTVSSASSFLVEINDFNKLKSGRLRVDVELEKVIFHDSIKKIKGYNLTLFIDSTFLNINIGDKIYFKGDIIQSKFYSNPGEIDFSKFYRIKKILGTVFIRGKCSFKIYKNPDLFFHSIQSFKDRLNDVLSGNELAIAKAFLWGDRDLLTIDSKEAFTNTGTIHILAVSGLHVGLLLYITMSIFRIFSRFITRNVAVVLSLFLIWFYAFLTGFSPSILRSVMVFSFLVYVKTFSKSYNDLSILSLSALLLLIIDSNYLFDLGFQLTYAAVLGIIVLVPILKSFKSVDNKLINYFYEPLLIGVAAQIFTIPIILYNFNQFPNYFVISNLLLVPFSFLIMINGISYYIFSSISILKVFFGKLLMISIKSMFYIVNMVNDFPFSVAKQFEFTYFDVVFYVFLLLFIVSVLKSKRQFNYSYSLFFISFLFLLKVQYVRYLNLNKNVRYKYRGVYETYLFKNNSSFILVSKSRNLKKLDYLFKSLNKKYQIPGKIIFLKKNQMISRVNIILVCYNIFD
jgi:competence protein ComEC